MRRKITGAYFYTRDGSFKPSAAFRSAYYGRPRSAYKGAAFDAAARDALATVSAETGDHEQAGRVRDALAFLCGEEYLAQPPQEAPYDRRNYMACWYDHNRHYWLGAAYRGVFSLDVDSPVADTARKAAATNVLVYCHYRLLGLYAELEAELKAELCAYCGQPGAALLCGSEGCSFYHRRGYV